MSVGRRCCGLVSWTANKTFWFCFWLGMLVPLAIIGVFIAFTVTLYNIPVDNRNIQDIPNGVLFREGNRVTWKEPFIYEAKVYVSTRQRVSDNETQFFEKAELVWRSGHQSIEDKFPHFRGKATVSLPESLSVITDSVHRGLYAHIFIQEAWDVPSQDPNLGDPLLIHSVQPIVWWEPQEIDDTFRFISSHGHPHPSSSRKSNADYQLVAAQSASWGMTMEPNAVKMANTGGCKGNKWLAND
ncbi:hypothetical protein LPJ81_005551, partial [Coemansia sp. IMI 209127]